jgi:hypothetical protein
VKRETRRACRRPALLCPRTIVRRHDDGWGARRAGCRRGAVAQSFREVHPNSGVDGGAGAAAPLVKQPPPSPTARTPPPNNLVLQQLRPQAQPRPDELAASRIPPAPCRRQKETRPAGEQRREHPVGIRMHTPSRSTPEVVWCRSAVSPPARAPSRAPTNCLIPSQAGEDRLGEPQVTTPEMLRESPAQPVEHCRMRACRWPMAGVSRATRSQGAGRPRRGHESRQ